MSNCSGKIHIGGKVSAKMDKELRKAILKDVSYLFVDKNDKEYLTLNHHDLPEGVFERTENFCMSNNIPFIRESAVTREHHAMKEVFIPGVMDASIKLGHGRAERHIPVTYSEPIHDILTAAKYVTFEEAPKFISHENKTLRLYAEHLLGGESPFNTLIKMIEESLPVDIRGVKLPPYEVIPEENT